MKALMVRRVLGFAVVASIVAPARGQQAAATTPASSPADVVAAARLAAKEGKLLFRLSTPEEVKAVLGPPTKQRTEKDGDSQRLTLEYPGLHAAFASAGWLTPFTLLEIVVADAAHHNAARGESLDIGAERTLLLRNVNDLARMDPFTGLANVSLVHLDLTDQLPRLDRLNFDSRTKWPPAGKRPRGFDPAGLLVEGRNPGLGVRGLHARGIDGRGVHIAIIDQPLLREHREYQDRVVRYEPIDVDGVPPQMHGAAVTSIAVGRLCGTAPAAVVHYYATPMWKWWNEHCKAYAELLDRIVVENRRLPAGQTVRVVSISLGAFSQWPDHELWVRSVERAAQEGVLVVSCDPVDLRIAILKRNLAEDPDSPGGYGRPLLFNAGNALGVPAGNRVTAYFSGPEDYMFWRDGGMSWTVPYLAGLAALACQVDPDIKPRAIVNLWRKTAWKTAAGPVVDPPAFIEAVQKAKAAAKPTG